MSSLSTWIRYAIVYRFNVNAPLHHRPIVQVYIAIIVAHAISTSAWRNDIRTRHAVGNPTNPVESILPSGIVSHARMVSPICDDNGKQKQDSQLHHFSSAPSGAGVSHLRHGNNPRAAHLHSIRNSRRPILKSSLLCRRCRQISNTLDHSRALMHHSLRSSPPVSRWSMRFRSLHSSHANATAQT